MKNKARKVNKFDFNNVCIKYNRTFSIVKKQQKIGWGSSQQWCNDLRESFLNIFFWGSCVIFALCWVKICMEKVDKWLPEFTPAIFAQSSVFVDHCLSYIFWSLYDTFPNLIDGFWLLNWYLQVFFYRKTSLGIW